MRVAMTVNSSPPGARDEVLLAHAAGKPRRGLAQQRVTGAVAQRVVDDLEAVQVEQSCWRG